mmetsp:Transcript_5301/g.13581  ORF Transcript_5301/g.13581 Transcript_5301/m.13581 type:complete len:216 (-) Transcript_5301:369-1016(-)
MTAASEGRAAANHISIAGTRGRPRLHRRHHLLFASSRSTTSDSSGSRPIRRERLGRLAVYIQTSFENDNQWLNQRVLELVVVYTVFPPSPRISTSPNLKRSQGRVTNGATAEEFKVPATCFDQCYRKCAEPRSACTTHTCPDEARGSFHWSCCGGIRGKISTFIASARYSATSPTGFQRVSDGFPPSTPHLVDGMDFVRRSSSLVSFPAAPAPQQ